MVRYNGEEEIKRMYEKKGGKEERVYRNIIKMYEECFDSDVKDLVRRIVFLGKYPDIKKLNVEEFAKAVEKSIFVTVVHNLVVNTIANSKTLDNSHIDTLIYELSKLREEGVENQSKYTVDIKESEEK